MPSYCKFENCKLRSSFNYFGLSALYCGTHREDGMINVNIKKCEHNRDKSHCKECNGSQICEHKRERSICKDCGGASICEHKRYRSICKECDGISICEHKRQKSHCKECGGSQICEHNIIKSVCKDCDGNSLCEHKRQKVSCKECNGSQVCKHKKQRSSCKECNGSQICEHNKIRSICKDCCGGSICEHDRRRTLCVDYDGGSFCYHDNIRSRCKECNFIGYLAYIVASRVRNSLKSNKDLHSQEYLGCSIEEFKIHIESQFKKGMTWYNHGREPGDWQIDHIIPIKYKDGETNLEELIKRLHYTNTQPMWMKENLIKGNRFIY